jgi:hypothetical protein
MRISRLNKREALIVQIVLELFAFGGFAFTLSITSGPVGNHGCNNDAKVPRL